MHNKIVGCCVLLCLCTMLARPVAAQQNQKSLKQSMADLKKALHPDKAFILPFTDSTNEDLQAFLFAVESTKGVQGAKLNMKGGKAVITVDASESLTSIWNNMDKEFHNRYRLVDRTTDGFILEDTYQKKTSK